MISWSGLQHGEVVLRTVMSQNRTSHDAAQVSIGIVVQQNYLDDKPGYVLPKLDEGCLRLVNGCARPVRVEV